MTLRFDFDFTVETLDADLSLDYESTRYLNETQDIKYQMHGIV